MNRISDLTYKPFAFGIAGGEPQQSAAISEEIDGGRIQQGVWECGPGELDLKFAWNETVYILEGRADIENMSTGEKFVLLPGSLMCFEDGSHWLWRIPWKLRKVFTIVEGRS